MDTGRRVTYLVDSASYGGAERTVAQLLAGVPRRFTAAVVASAPVPPPLAAAAGDRLVPISGPSRSWRLLPAAVAALRRTTPEIVHVNCIDPRSNRALLAAALSTGAATVATVHMTGDCGRRGPRAALRWLYRRFDAVIAVSGEIHSLLVGELGVAASRVRLITNGVEGGGRRPGSPAAERVTVDGGRLHIGGVGRLTAQKGWDVLIDAVGQLTAEGLPVTLTIAGEGRDRAALEARAAGLPVAFAGFLDDVPSFLAGVDIFCLPSRAEGLPLALLEALMAGVPAVATTVGAVPEAVGDAAVLVPSGDPAALAGALRHLAADGPARRRLGAAGAATARARFDVRRTVADVVAVYDRLSGGDALAAPPSRAAGSSRPVGERTDSYKACTRAARASQW